LRRRSVQQPHRIGFSQQWESDNTSARQSEQGGIVGTYTGKDSRYSFRGNIGGMRVLK